MNRGTDAYRRLFESHPVAMAIWDPATGRIVAVNDAAVRQYGYAAAEARTLILERLVHPADWPRLSERLSTTPPGHVDGETFRHLRKDGTTIDVEVTSHDLLFEGRPCRLVMALDVTERRRLDQLAGGIAHDFNNLLMVINGFSELLVGRLPAGDELEAARQIRAAGYRAAALTQQLLTFATPGFDHQAEPTRAKPPRSDPARPAAILVAEDEPAVLTLIERVLTGAGYVVLPASTGRQALDIMLDRAGDIDLLVSDAVMPGMAGVGLARQLRLGRPDLPILFVSGWAGEAFDGEWADAPGVELLLKPFEVSVLLDRVRGLLAAGSSAGRREVAPVA